MEERVISLRKDRVISLSKKVKNSDGSEIDENIKYIYTGLSWGKIKKRYGERIERNQQEEVTYTGNWFQKLLHIGPKEVKIINKDELIDPGYLREKEVDLDSSLVCYDKSKKVSDIIYFGKKENLFCKHFGDDTHGGVKKDKDNEMIRIDLSSAPSEINYIVVIVNSYSHDLFNEIPFIKMRIYGSDMINKGSKVNNLKTFAEYCIDNNPEFNEKEAIVLGAFFRDGQSWKFKAGGESTKETSIRQMAEGSAKKLIENI